MKLFIVSVVILLMAFLSIFIVRLDSLFGLKVRSRMKKSAYKIAFGIYLVFMFIIFLADVGMSWEEKLRLPNKPGEIWVGFVAGVDTVYRMFLPDYAMVTTFLPVSKKRYVIPIRYPMDSYEENMVGMDAHIWNYNDGGRYLFLNNSTEERHYKILGSNGLGKGVFPLPPPIPIEQ